MLVAFLASGCGTEPTTISPAASDTRSLKFSPKYEPKLSPKPGESEQEATEKTVIIR